MDLNETREIIRSLVAQGFSAPAIACQTGLTIERVRDVIHMDKRCPKRIPPVPAGYERLSTASKRTGIKQSRLESAVKRGHLKYVLHGGVILTKPEWIDIWIRNTRRRRRAAQYEENVFRDSPKPAQ